jgi:hypothetical protein
VLDLAEYLYHRLQHRTESWWALHSVHHSQRQLSFWADDRSHVLDGVLREAFLATVALVIGVPGTQFALIAGAWSVPEPDVAVVPGTLDDYEHAHPTTALLVVEVSNTSLKQDRLSKSRIYAAASIPEYWIVNLRESVVEVMRDPDPATALYRDTRICTAGDVLELAALPSACVAVAELLPTRS